LDAPLPGAQGGRHAGGIQAGGREAGRLFLTLSRALKREGSYELRRLAASTVDEGDDIPHDGVEVVVLGGIDPGDTGSRQLRRILRRDDATDDHGEGAEPGGL